MKKIISLIITMFVLALYSCEKDDICQEGTPNTPRLVIEFYDINSPTNKKNITDLQISTPSSEKTLYYTNLNKIQLPLNTNANSVTYTLTLNAKNIAISKTDLLTVKYNRADLYLSRACGYISIFELPLENATDINTPKQWIQDIKVLQTKIENENTTHVKIYF